MDGELVTIDNNRLPPAYKDKLQWENLLSRPQASFVDRQERTREKLKDLYSELGDWLNYELGFFDGITDPSSGSEIGSCNAFSTVTEDCVYTYFYQKHWEHLVSPDLTDVERLAGEWSLAFVLLHELSVSLV